MLRTSLVLLLIAHMRGGFGYPQTIHFNSSHEAKFPLAVNTKVQMFRSDVNNEMCSGIACKTNPCPVNHTPQTIYYKLFIETRYSMSPACGDCPHTIDHCFNNNCITADGVKRKLYLFNGQLPGPIFEVCKGDTLVIDVLSHISPLSIHWHGITQRGSPWQDGASYVTQCPMGFRTNYQYQFVASDIGSHFWSTELLQDGLVGGLIVRSGDDPWLEMYDIDEHVVFIQTWKHTDKLAEFVAAGSTAPATNTPQAILINGKGAVCNRGGRRSLDSSVEESDDECTNIPLARFKVHKNRNYRMRIINGGGYDCPIQFQIESHQMIVIAADGPAIAPVPEVKTIVLMQGERYDVVVAANQEINSYWILVKAIGNCSADQIYQRAILTYDGAESDFPKSPNPGYNSFSLGLVLNPLSKDCIGTSDSEMFQPDDSSHHDTRAICAYQLRSLEGTNYPATTNTVKKILNFNTTKTNVGGVEKPMSDINGKSQVNPPSLVMGNPDIFTSYSELRCNPLLPTVQKCFHNIQFNLGDVVNLIMVDSRVDPVDPTVFHLHGYKFDLLYQGFSVDEAENDQLLNIKCPSKRDTLVVPAGGVVRIRFLADNPGTWLLQKGTIIVSFSHGMGVTLQVGTSGDLPPKPLNFGQCDRPVLLPPGGSTVIDDVVIIGFSSSESSSYYSVSSYSDSSSSSS